MGAFFTNYHVRCDSQQRVHDALKALTTSGAYISPPRDGWVTIYEESSDSQNEQILRRIVEGLSRTLNTPTIAFLVHDSDILLYFLYDSGNFVDEFNSSPEYFGKEDDASKLQRVRGNTVALLKYCKPGTNRDRLDALLHPPDGGPAFAEELLLEIAGHLGIPEDRIPIGFNYFDEAREMLPDADRFQSLG